MKLEIKLSEAHKNILNSYPQFHPSMHDNVRKILMHFYVNLPPGFSNRQLADALDYAYKHSDVFTDLLITLASYLHPERPQSKMVIATYMCNHPTVDFFRDIKFVRQLDKFIPKLPPKSGRYYIGPDGKEYTKRPKIPLAERKKAYDAWRLKWARVDSGPKK